MKIERVPETFECDAVRKGRAIEWARREFEVDFALSESVYRNEAPPSLGEILQQRRR